jgi:hypothetical protein
LDGRSRRCRKVRGELRERWGTWEVAEAAETLVLAVLQARTARDLTKATDRLAFYTKALIFIAILQAVAIIVAAIIAR